MYLRMNTRDSYKIPVRIVHTIVMATHIKSQENSNEINSPYAEYGLFFAEICSDLLYFFDYLVFFIFPIAFYRIICYNNTVMQIYL